MIERIEKMQENLGHLGQWIQHEPRRWTGLVRKLMVARKLRV